MNIVPPGWWNWRFTFAAVSGSAIKTATEAVVDKARSVAAHLLEASTDDIVINPDEEQLELLVSLHHH